MRCQKIVQCFNFGGAAVVQISRPVLITCLVFYTMKIEIVKPQGCTSIPCQLTKTNVQ